MHFFQMLQQELMTLCYAESFYNERDHHYRVYTKIHDASHLELTFDTYWDVRRTRNANVAVQFVGRYSIDLRIRRTGRLELTHVRQLFPSYMNPPEPLSTQSPNKENYKDYMDLNRALDRVHVQQFAKEIHRQATVVAMAKASLLRVPGMKDYISLISL
jgi:hypothetical protein